MDDGKATKTKAAGASVAGNRNSSVLFRQEQVGNLVSVGGG